LLVLFVWLKHTLSMSCNCNKVVAQMNEKQQQNKKALCLHEEAPLFILTAEVGRLWPFQW